MRHSGLQSLTSLTAQKLQHTTTMPIQLFNQINASGIKQDRVVVLRDSHGTLVNLVQEDGKDIVFQTPRMPLAWDTKVRMQQGKAGCNLPLSFSPVTPASEQFREWLGDVHKQLCKLVVENSVQWAGRQISEQEVSMPTLFGPLVKPPSDPKYSSSFVAKVDFVEDTSDVSNSLIKLEVDGEDLRPVQDVEAALRRGTKCVGIISIPYVHIQKGGRMVSARLDARRCMVSASASSDTSQMEYNMEDEEVKAAVEQAQKRKREEDDKREQENTHEDKAPRQDAPEEYAEQSEQDGDEDDV